MGRWHRPRRWHLRASGPLSLGTWPPDLAHAIVDLTAGRWQLDRDPNLLETSVPGIFACGDVRFGPVKRVAAAVGEGSMAIAFVHKYLTGASKPVRRHSPTLGRFDSCAAPLALKSELRMSIS